jgi:hypothetical protein
MLIYLPLLFVSKLMGAIAPAIMLTQMKYMVVFAAYARFNTDYFKNDHPEVYKFFTNDPSSIGFQSTLSLTILILMMFTVIASIGAQIQHVMSYFRACLVFFQIYTLFSQIGTFDMIKNFGWFDKEGHINVTVLQFVLTWVVLLFPFFVRPIDMLTNFTKYTIGCVCFYLSYFWWYVLFNIYSFSNLDDVSWGNRPANKSNGLNVVVDDVKRQEILRQNYRTTRTNILIWWLFANIFIMYVFDALVLSAVHNQNVDLKATCQSIIKGYAMYICITQITVMTLATVHHVDGFFRGLLCGRFIPATIYKRQERANDPETKVLLDSEEEDFIPPVVAFQKKKEFSKKGKSNFETDENISFFSDDIESQ